MLNHTTSGIALNSIKHYNVCEKKKIKPGYVVLKETLNSCENVAIPALAGRCQQCSVQLGGRQRRRHWSVEEAKSSAHS